MCLRSSDALREKGVRRATHQDPVACRPSLVKDGWGRMGEFSSLIKGIPMKKVSLRHAPLTFLVLASLVVAPAFVPAADDASSSLPAAPVAKKVPRTPETNGHPMVDNYFWLRDKKNPAVKNYLEP